MKIVKSLLLVFGYTLAFSILFLFVTKFTASRVCAATSNSCSATSTQASCVPNSLCHSQSGRVTQNDGSITCTATQVCCDYTNPQDVPASLQQTQQDVINSAINGDVNGGSWVAGLPLNQPGSPLTKGYNGVFFNMINAAIIGAGGLNKTSLVYQPDGTKKYVTYSSPGAIQSTVAYTAMLYQHAPASSVEYVADVIQDIKRPFGAQPAYAQGLGFSSLTPILSLWKIFRNLSYFLFVLIFLVVGFLIMFRAKIGSQTAVTVQQALPKLVVSLILVTFSYAIAGFMIDIMYLVIYLIISIFHGQPGLPTDLAQIAFQKDIISNGLSLAAGTANTIASAMGSITTGVLQNLGWADATSSVAGFGVGVIFILILIIAVLFSLFRIFFALLKAYVGIFFSVIFAPIFLLMGALPGQNTFGTWIKGLIENLLVFPTIVLLIFITYFFSGFKSNVSGGFSAPQLGSNQGAGFQNYQALLALGAIMAMPEVVKIVQGIMKGQLGVGVEDLQKNLSKGQKLGTRLGGGLLGAGVGGGLGAVVGTGIGIATANKGERLAGGLKGLGFGAVGGAGIGALAPTIAPQGFKIGRRLASTTISQGAQAAGIALYKDWKNERELSKDQKKKEKDEKMPPSSPAPIKAPTATTPGHTPSTDEAGF